MTSVTVHGVAARGFGRVADVFADLFAHRGESGAAVALVLDGRTVVDLWAGVADTRTGRPWTADTTTSVFSCTKGLLTICAYLAVQRGELDLDAPVARYWPEFGQEGKDDVPVRWLFSHRVGLPVVDRDLTMADVLAWSPVVRALARQKPLWAPGTAHSYHTMSFGWLVGEVLRRATGRTPGRLVAGELAEPLGMRTWLGLPDPERESVAWTLAAPEAERAIPVHPVNARARTMCGAFPFPADDDGNVVFNEPAVRAAGLPGAGLISTARDLARVYAACVSEVDGGRLLAPTSVADALVVRSEGQEVYGPPYAGRRWGTGFLLNSPPTRRMLTDVSFGHDGAGGHLAFADPALRAGFGYVTTRMRGPADDRSNLLTAAVRDCLAIAA
ncbi:serine hydrolase domain-containing protein [Actinophytocola oryzae]|uniref:CubicO group peptidase (Beta-lactamase class C family) n=1 Tax=Actinophytocola oryzae TaxID=502181 RepID=A0A4R7VYF3_9PSEU|nr:serine hydrolase domain-containing protein [Actinophytocola oryzae]TDV54247.1 CubicO group peptidase (beta-lactamase class C family) [Actinophytocola oryzae]